MMILYVVTDIPAVNRLEDRQTPEQFIQDTDISFNFLSSSTVSHQRFNKMILIGDPVWVRGMIYRLHTAGIAEVNA